VWWIVLFAGIFFMIRAALQQHTIKLAWHRLLLKMPVTSRLTRGVNAERLANTLGILTASGIPLLNAMQSAVQVVTNLPMRAAVDNALNQIREGGSLSRSLGQAKLFPPLVIHLIASGESSGKLDMMLTRAAEAQSRELENWVKTFTSLLEPLLIVVMGVAVLLIVMAILLPIFEMNQLIR
jgi:general secretion pathway protein F